MQPHRVVHLHVQLINEDVQPVHLLQSTNHSAPCSVEHRNEGGSQTDLLVVCLLEHAGELQAEVRKRVIDERVPETMRGEQDLVYGVDRLQELCRCYLSKSVSTLVRQSFLQVQKSQRAISRVLLAKARRRPLQHGTISPESAKEHSPVPRAPAGTLA